MLKKSNQKGFTIIEVLIVLAIAAVILIIVFFAVPALQRNSRNTQLRNDANVLLGYAGDFVANNTGKTPTCINAVSGAVTMGSAAQATPCTTDLSSMGNIRGGTTVVGARTTALAAAPDGSAAASLGSLYYAPGYKCNGSALGGANARAVAILFYTETSTSGTPQCIES